MTSDYKDLPKAPISSNNTSSKSSLNVPYPHEKVNALDVESTLKSNKNHKTHTKVDYDVFDNNIDLAVLMRSAAKKYSHLRDDLTKNDALVELLQRDERLKSSIVKVFNDRIDALEEQSVQLLETTIENSTADGTSDDIKTVKDILDNVPFD